MQNTTIEFIMKDGKLELANPADILKMKDFLKKLQEGDKVEAYMAKSEGSDGTLAQLAKVHACIKELARFTGTKFEDMKNVIKYKAGLLNVDTAEIKSFGDCSKAELSDAIQTCIDIGNEIGYYF